MKTAGIVAICIDADGTVRAYGTIGFGLPSELVCLLPEAATSSGWRCCAALPPWPPPRSSSSPRISTSACPVTATLSPAPFTVAAVDHRIREMQANGGMADVNRTFKAARASTSSLRYRDHLDAFKIKLVEQMARR
jgi:hypothetical protein